MRGSYFKVSGGMADPSLLGVMYTRKGRSYLGLSTGEKFEVEEGIDSLFEKYGRGLWELSPLVEALRKGEKY